MRIMMTALGVSTFLACGGTVLALVVGSHGTPGARTGRHWALLASVAILAAWVLMVLLCEWTIDCLVYGDILD